MPLRKRSSVLLSHIIAVSKWPHMPLRKRTPVFFKNGRFFSVIYRRLETAFIWINEMGVRFFRGIYWCLELHMRLSKLLYTGVSKRPSYGLMKQVW